jgi:hypothetical protein
MFRNTFRNRQKKAPNLVRLEAFNNPAITYSPTGATLQYHRRNIVSLLCSEWEQVVPARYRRRKDVIVLLTTEYGE